MAVACGEEYIVKKRERKIIILRLWKNIKLGNEEDTEISGKKIKISKTWGGEEYQILAGELYTTLP